MIELPVDRRKFLRAARQFQLRMLVPRLIWRGGWYIALWDSRRRRWEPAFDIPDLECGPFLRHQKKWARAQIAGFRLLYPRWRFRLQPVGAKWILDLYTDHVWCPDDPDRDWFERWGGGSPLWKMLRGQPAC